MSEGQKNFGNKVIRGLRHFLKRLFRSHRKPRPKYLLRPDRDGTYSLLQWDSSLGIYMVVAVNLTKDNAADKIKNLERDVEIPGQ